ncbi:MULTISPECIES: phosphoribosylformylglycinamidine synthase subunit PurQ [Dethiosulfovibrio]|uniref:Phosphoribosylformylglycinamidine synthase subunit PurQ n=2 Tax=Dethiosulfovibrio TaxID=47054 RepID=A0ABS9EL34_9BACT|nr:MULTISPECIES: phosphoribosylformylglycinamidine synthase subunit PurQ [Dethiosulfovibrio]MCF4113449.1 phosphoribosylformylglycinamidine synthase subunit PurQ [Dethiosulfovibrio russensis]MCF4141919.1 phosphoribosylformylglycinamidine synthase subunit PurQ [Dethiosulfovibrio marinus]MCF4144074.1 phosphoribosylformylglycinamidine synthase subunit PurQ [Dethiosulfovibrio acidaminovorans]MEA3284184.1 phosphoribosylformylglycinamidine synthase subunit PurQ [Synergistota bacterium]
MNVAVVVFPGSNCDRDVVKAIKYATGDEAELVWHGETELPGETDLVVLPGGFSYGDYLRCGAMAHTAPIMADVKRHADRGGLVLGICNGFQVLTESKMLPGALLVNRDLAFICRPVEISVERDDTAFTSGYEKGQVITVPIAHYEGRYHLPEDELELLEKRGQVAFRYSGGNPNGALNDIAGIYNEGGNVLGMMPHPERYSDRAVGGDDGLPMWLSIKRWIERTGA